jgi:hypothetical protein
MRRSVSLLGGALVIALTCQGVAKADWWVEFRERVKLDFHRNNCWPNPFDTADRQLTRSYMAIMADNGWQLQNTLGEYHFDEETNELNSAGAAKLTWILTRTPLHRRTVFIHRTLADNSTKTRLDSVQQMVARIVPKGDLPEVLLSDTPPAVSPGYYSDAISRSLRENIPKPVLQGAKPSSGGGP